MKRFFIIIINTLIVLGVIVFVSLYTHSETLRQTAAQTEAFENMTVALEQVTANYLTGEQRICDVWAHYINNKAMTMEEAVDFIAVSHVLPYASAHLLYIDDGSFSGLSTRPNAADPSRRDVSYAALDLFGDLDSIGLPGEGVNITRAYTNPTSGVQSIAFLNRIRLRDGARLRDALLLRVLPLSDLERAWVFPRNAYTAAEISLIDEEGAYVIRGRSFKNANFFEFYKSYNETDYNGMEALRAAVSDGSGSFTMQNSHGEECLVAYTPVQIAGHWLLLSSIPKDELGLKTADWMLIGIVAAGLLALFVFDLALLFLYSRRLKAAAAEAEAANRAKTDFLSTMSHDIRTPMNAIIGLTTLSERNVSDTAAVRENLRKIGLAGNHLLTLINDILDISKVESGKLTLNPVTFSLVEAAENLVNLSQPMIREKNIRFNFRTGRVNEEYLTADPLRLNQICINLLSNAIKYTEPGGEVSVDLREEPCGESGRVRLVYTVSDTGIGMTPEFMARMYQPFSRQTDSRVNAIQGTGLGLAITRRMVELMDGTIECDSAVGRGTTFTVTLTLPVAERRPEEMSLPPVRVLVVDDDPVLLDTARETLSSLGASADVVASGAEAVARIREAKEAYDVVILDWKMPDMDGVAAARVIRETAGSEIPILLVSAYDWSEIEEKAREAGVNGFVRKPLFRSTLYETISGLLGREIAPAEDGDEGAGLAGMHILVAEDNDINWEIISMMLDMYGIETERAENGLKAVEAVRSRGASFDLIFMDIQMPVMNGLEATRSIRALPDEALSRIPIIAMTADAFSENVAECLAAGMNGHIAKPIDLKLVLKEIRRIKEEKK